MLEHVKLREPGVIMAMLGVLCQVCQHTYKCWMVFLHCHYRLRDLAKIINVTLGTARQR